MGDGERAGKSPGDSRRMSATLIQALDHPSRREVLRHLHRLGKPQSANGLSKLIDAPGTTISYHLKVLLDLGVISLESEQQVRAVFEKLFASEVSEHETVVAILADTEQEDAQLRKTGR